MSIEKISRISQLLIFMAGTKEKYSLTLIGLILAALGVVAPITWDWWNKNSQLSFVIMSQASIVTTAQPVTRLQILFAGKEINDLSRVRIRLQNTGRTPITNEDVVSNTYLTLTNGEFLEASLLKTTPPNMDVSIQASGNKINCFFALLNPGEFADIDMLISSKAPQFASGGRIKNISVIPITDSSHSFSFRRDVGYSTLIVGVFGLFFLAFNVHLVRLLPARRRAISALKNSRHASLSGQNRMQARTLIYGDFPLTNNAGRQIIDSALDNLNWPLVDESQREHLKNCILAADKSENYVATLIITFIPTLMAFSYIALKFIH